MRGPAAPPPGRLAEGLQPSLPPFTIAPMRKLLTLWDQDLRRLAERLPPMERTRAIQRWRLFPLLPTIPTAVLFQALGAAPIVTTCATVVVAASALGIYALACARLITHGQAYDRTPPWQPWHDSREGRLFLDALRPYPAENLRRLSLDTDLHRGLGLQGDHLQGLLVDLAKLCQVERLPLGPGPFAPSDGVSPLEALKQARGEYQSLKVGRLLEAMAQALAP